MMKKIFLMLFCSLLFISFDEAYAANLCTINKYETLQNKVDNIEIDWELEFDDNNNYYFIVSIKGVDKDLLLKHNGIVYEPENGIIVLETFLQGGNDYSFKFYGGYEHSCVEEYVATKTIKIPKYNKYSELDVCKNREKWEICDKWYSGDFNDEADFYEKFEEYKRKVENGEIIIESDTSYGIIFVIAIVILIIVMLLLYVLKTKKKVKRKKV